MSRHLLRTATLRGDTVLVVLGYDRPLDYVFCTVLRENDEEYMYSNLSDEQAGVDLQEVDYFRDKLFDLGIEVPDQMFEEVKRYQLDRVGNRTVDHSPVR